MRNCIVAIFLIAITFPAQLCAQLQRGALIDIPDMMALPIITETVKNAGDNGFLFAYGGNRNTPVYLSFDGNQSYKYELSQVPRDQVNPYFNWSDLTSDGSSTYFLWNLNPVAHVPLAHCKLSRFELNGHYRDTVTMDGDYYSCDNLAVLDHNTLILLATSLDRTPFVGVYQTNGQLVKRIELPDDLRLTDDAKKKLGSLEFRDQFILDTYASMSLIDNDGDGNVVITRRYINVDGDAPRDTVLFSISRSLEVHRIALERPKTKYGYLIQVRPLHGKIVTLSWEHGDASELGQAYLNVYSLKGALLRSFAYDKVFGGTLLDWNDHHGLFLSQAGDPRAKVRHLGIIEALRQ